MMQINYIKDTINTLEQAVQPETLLDDDDYQKIALRILKCESFIEDKKISAKIDVKWFSELTDFFYDKMMKEIGDDEEKE